MRIALIPPFTTTTLRFGFGPCWAQCPTCWPQCPTCWPLCPTCWPPSVPFQNCLYQNFLFRTAFVQLFLVQNRPFSNFFLLRIDLVHILPFQKCHFPDGAFSELSFSRLFLFMFVLVQTFLFVIIIFQIIPQNYRFPVFPFQHCPFSDVPVFLFRIILFKVFLFKLVIFLSVFLFGIGFSDFKK